ncbi:MAG: fadL [Ignavibacteria bacterium]|nr:fadL [Ignavibacteria bacterium]
MKILILTFSTLIILNGNLFAGGFQLNDHSARSVAMGFSTVANISDPSAIYYNPACIAFDAAELSFLLGSSYIMPGGKFTGITTLNEQKTTSLETWNFLIPNFFGTWRTPIEGLSFGVGVFVPFGLGTRWPSDWVGRFTAVETYLQTVEINPNLAYNFKIGDIPISIAAGFGYVIGNVELKRNLSTFNPEPILQLKGDGNGTTFNAGLSVQPCEMFKFGASYRHNIEIEFEGDVSYDNITGLESKFQEGTGKTKINLPNDFRFGIAYQVRNDLWVELGINYVGWSSYDTLAIKFDKGPGAPASTYESKNARLYKDVITYRLGAEYKFDEYCTLRCGGFYDPMPVEAKYVEPMLPEGNRLGGSLGFGYSINKTLSLDLGYMGIVAMQTESKDDTNLSKFSGIYNSWANIISLSINVKF